MVAPSSLESVGSAVARMVMSSARTSALRTSAASPSQRPRSARAAPVIANLRSHVEAVSRQELKRVAPQLANLTERERAAVESLTQRLIDKMFHHLVVRLRLAAQTDPKLVEAAEFFFLHGEGGLFEHAGARQEEKEPHA